MKSRSGDFGGRYGWVGSCHRLCGFHDGDHLRADPGLWNRLVALFTSVVRNWSFQRALKKSLLARFRAVGRPSGLLRAAHAGGESLDGITVSIRCSHRQRKDYWRTPYSVVVEVDVPVIASVREFSARPRSDRSRRDVDLEALFEFGCKPMVSAACLKPELRALLRELGCDVQISYGVVRVRGGSVVVKPRDIDRVYFAALRVATVF